jgi:hypothetical protein
MEEESREPLVGSAQNKSLMGADLLRKSQRRKLKGLLNQSAIRTSRCLVFHHKQLSRLLVSLSRLFGRTA